MTDAQASTPSSMSADCLKFDTRLRTAMHNVHQESRGQEGP